MPMRNRSICRVGVLWVVHRESRNLRVDILGGWEVGGGFGVGGRKMGSDRGWVIGRLLVDGCLWLIVVLCLCLFVWSIYLLFKVPINESILFISY